jgi:SAM-dependent methyltransferase
VPVKVWDGAQALVRSAIEAVGLAETWTRAPGILTTRPRTWTPVDAYWGRHTVNSKPFASAADSERYLQWRFEQYPLFREFMEMWGEHEDKVVLDYGCGPGDDLVGFLLYSRARKVIGVDVSPTALRLAQRRLALHRVDRARVELIRTGDGAVELPLQDGLIDYVNCGGVLHHTTEPKGILAELHRVLRRGGTARIMVYNRDSVWFHLYVAYVKVILEGAFPGLSVEEAFARSTDGMDCPISRCYRPEDFLRLVAGAGFDATYLGGYLSRWELGCLAEHGAAAREDSRLGIEHREFLRSLEFDVRGLPRYRGKHAGIGGTYAARKAG